MSLSLTQTFQSQYLSNPHGENLLYFKLILFNLTEFIVLHVKVYSIEVQTYMDQKIIVCGKDSIPLSAYEFILFFFRRDWDAIYDWYQQFCLLISILFVTKKNLFRKPTSFYTKRFPMPFLLIFIPFKYGNFLGADIY